MCKQSVAFTPFFCIFLQNILNYNHYELNDKLIMGPNW